MFRFYRFQSPFLFIFFLISVVLIFTGSIFWKKPQLCMDSCYDVVIPVHKKDVYQLPDMLNNTRKTLIGYRNIHIISSDPQLTQQQVGLCSDCYFHNENLFPFYNLLMKETKRKRSGWLLQQLIKLYAADYIPTLSENYFVLDSEVYFLRPLSFLTTDGRAILTPGMKKTSNGQFHKPYFDHMRILHPSLQRVDVKISGIADHMLMNKKIVHQLFKLVEDYHSKPFWRVFIDSVNWDTKSSASEFEIYFNYIAKYHNDTFVLRPLYLGSFSESKRGASVQKYRVLGPAKPDYVTKHCYISTKCM